MPAPSFLDQGTYNLKDIDTGLFVGKVHVEAPAADLVGGRGHVMHWALVKSPTGESGWGVWVKPTQQLPKQVKFEGTGETLAQFIGWMHAPDRKGDIRYLFQGTREIDFIP